MAVATCAAFWEIKDYTLTQRTGEQLLTPVVTFQI